MPTYHYECEKCGHEFEIDQSITDEPRKRCPECRGKVFRVIHPVGHILKGSGFYATDYRSEDFSKKELAEKKSDSPAPADKGSGKKKKDKTKAS
ncbi:MAG TPA: FmdB family zinc ribbon protein [Candidatus Krumholzibacterium sp.]|nr:FmdB family zinc ribbon protein [Candidatus Krumholzibacterium sp.]